MKKRFLGILLSTVLTVAAIMNPMVSAASDTVQDISKYRSADGNHTAPTELAPSEDMSLQDGPQIIHIKHQLQKTS